MRWGVISVPEIPPKMLLRVITPLKIMTTFVEFHTSITSFFLMNMNNLPIHLSSNSEKNVKIVSFVIGSTYPISVILNLDPS